MSDAPNDAAPQPDPGHLNRPLDAPRERVWLRAAQIGAGLWLAFHVLVPARYYALADHDVYDERFAWRMFSAVRVQECTTRVAETSVGGTRPVNLTTILPLPWIALVERNRPAVQRAMLEHLCDGPTSPSREEVTNVCQGAGEDDTITVQRSIDCESGAITESNDGGGS